MTIPDLPIIIAEWDRNAREIIRVALDQYRGKYLINARVWYRAGNELRPTKAGLTLSLRHLPMLIEAFTKASKKIAELGIENKNGPRA